MSARKWTIGIVGLAAALATLTACPPPPPAGVVYASVGPPPLQTEVVIVSPGPGFVWVPGYWGWGGTAYVWTRGAWIRPPHARARWVSPRWWHNSRGWYRTGGDWQ
jgi:hypothetical protein